MTAPCPVPRTICGPKLLRREADLVGNVTQHLHKQTAPLMASLGENAALLAAVQPDHEGAGGPTLRQAWAMARPAGAPQAGKEWWTPEEEDQVLEVLRLKLLEERAAAQRAESSSIEDSSTSTLAWAPDTVGMGMITSASSSLPTTETALVNSMAMASGAGARLSWR